MPANNFLFGEWKNGIRSPGAFDIISNNFAAGAKGDVIAIIPKANPGQVFGATELKALLENSNVTSINGLSRNTLLELVKDASNITPDELTNVFNFGSNGSDDQVMLTGYFAGGANRYHLQFDDATYQATELRGVRIWSKTVCRRVRSRSALWMLCVMPDLQPRPLLAAGNS